MAMNRRNMLCERCGKKVASVHVTKIINGNKTELYLCDTCAREKGENISFEGKFPLHQFFSGLMSFFPSGDADAMAPSSYSGLQCPECGLTYAQFGIGRLGYVNAIKLLAKFGSPSPPSPRQPKAHGQNSGQGGLLCQSQKGNRTFKGKAAKKS